MPNMLYETPNLDNLNAAIDNIIKNSVKGILTKPTGMFTTYTSETHSRTSKQPIASEQLAQIREQMFKNMRPADWANIDVRNVSAQLDTALFGGISISYNKAPYAATHMSREKIQPPVSESEKGKLKAQLKEQVGQKFTVGQYLALRTKARAGSKRVDRIYQIRQIVWSIDEVVIKALVVKQLTGPNYNICSMSQHDCKRVHVKYEPGLQVLSMELPWIPVNPDRVPSNKKKSLSKKNKVNNE